MPRTSKSPILTRRRFESWFSHSYGLERQSSLILACDAVGIRSRVGDALDVFDSLLASFFNAVPGACPAKAESGLVAVGLIIDVGCFDDRSRCRVPGLKPPKKSLPQALVEVGEGDFYPDFAIEIAGVKVPLSYLPARRFDLQYSLQRCDEVGATSSRFAD